MHRGSRSWQGLSVQFLRTKMAFFQEWVLGWVEVVVRDWADSVWRGKFLLRATNSLSQVGIFRDDHLDIRVIVVEHLLLIYLRNVVGESLFRTTLRLLYDHFVAVFHEELWLVAHHWHGHNLSCRISKTDYGCLCGQFKRHLERVGELEQLHVSPHENSLGPISKLSLKRMHYLSFVSLCVV